MQRILFPAFLISVFSIAAFSQTAESENGKIEINVCRPKITEAGRQSTFHFNYYYRAMTDKEGSIIEVKELLDHKKFRGLMNDEGVIPCIKKWKLAPSERHMVVISVGTTSAEDSLDISSRTVKIKILL